MGEAKRRGTREERVAQAVSREAAKPKLVPRLVRRPRPKLLGAMIRSVVGWGRGH